MKLTQEQKQIVSDIRKRIATTKRSATSRGFIDYRGCLKVCDELVNILDTAKTYMDEGQILLAYTIISVVLINDAKLANTADDSGGGVIFTKNNADSLLEELCDKCILGAEAAVSDAVLLQACKDVQNKAFDGLEDFSYAILVRVAKLSSTKNINKIYLALSATETMILSHKYHGNFYKENDCLVRIVAVRAAEGQEAADELTNKNLQYLCVRKLAVQRALEQQNFKRAEDLCLDVLKNKEIHSPYGMKWAEILFDVYKKEGDHEKQISAAYALLVQGRNTEYYDVLKDLYERYADWKTEYPVLLKTLSKALYYNNYMSILLKEKEYDLLLEQIKQHLDMALYYLQYLNEIYPRQIYAYCYNAIWDDAQNASNRRIYRKICKNINKFASYGGTEEAFALIEKLQEAYPRKPAFIQELGACEFAIRNPRNRSKIMNI